jgi:hypothetical protein
VGFAAHSPVRFNRLAADRRCLRRRKSQRFGERLGCGQSVIPSESRIVNDNTLEPFSHHILVTPKIEMKDFTTLALVVNDSIISPQLRTGACFAVATT